MAAPDVNTPCLAYLQMATRWDLPSTLMGGTLAMRAVRTKYLPQMPKETNEAYNARLAATVLYNCYGRTVHSLAGKPFSKAVVLDQDAPEPLQQMAPNVDLAGRGLTRFLRDLLVDILLYGKAHILVDHPEQPSPEAPATLAEERSLALRPYFTQISPPALIDWQARRVGGVEVLQRIRIREQATEPDGEWGQKIIQYVRVIFPDHFDLYREERKAWVPVRQNVPITLGKIPLVTIYGIHSGVFSGASPLEDLAFLNLRHWQSQSDQDNILHVVRVPLLHFAGFTEEDMSIVAIGPHRATRHSNPLAKPMFVEHSGAGIDAGRQDLQDLEARMESMGSEMLVRQPGNQTATAKAIDTAETMSSLQATVQALEAGCEQAFVLAEEWLGLPPEPVDVTINRDFGLSLRDAGDLDQLLKARLAREITQATYLQEIQRRGVLSEKVDIEGEIAGVQTEDPFGGSGGGSAGGGGP